jgi:hypothetical protein
MRDWHDIMAEHTWRRVWVDDARGLPTLFRVYCTCHNQTPYQLLMKQKVGRVNGQER